MCGIIGYTGKEDAREIMLDALELLEYRGYDSAGIALLNENGTKLNKNGVKVVSDVILKNVPSTTVGAMWYE